MKIRKACNADKENISILHIASIKKLCEKYYSCDQISAWTSLLIPSAYDQALREKAFLIACDSKQNLMGIGILDAKNAEVSAIYIHPDSVGKGVGSRLLNELERLAGNSNITTITVHSTLNAEGFYKVHGYIKEELTFHDLPNGSKLECVRMLKYLQTVCEQRP